MSFPLSPILRRRLLLAAGLVFALWSTWQVSQEDASDVAVPARTAPVQRRVANQAPGAAPVFTLDWPARVDAHQSVIDLFNPPAPVPTPAATANVAAVTPVLALKYVGRLDGTDHNHVFLADAQDRLITAKVGDAVAQGWRLTAANANQLVFSHTPTGQEQTLVTGAIQ